jgi:hypothetical protein
MWSAVVDMPRTALLLLVSILAVSTLVKAVRWAFYLRSAGLNISWTGGLTSYLAGMSATALPGGSFLSARLAQEHGDVRMREAAPAIFISMVADASAISLLALGMSTITDQGRGRFAIPMIGLLMAFVFVAMGRSERVWRFVDRLLGRFRPTRGWLPKEADIHERVSAMMRTPVLLRGVGLSILTTLLSIVFLYVVVNALTFRGIRVLEAAAIHTNAETVGFVLPISFGISVSDSSLVGMLNSLGIGWVRVMFIVLAIRSLNIIFRTVVGTVMLIVCYHGLLRSTMALERRTRGVRRHAWYVGRGVSRSPARVARVIGFTRHHPRTASGGAIVTSMHAPVTDATHRGLLRPQRRSRLTTPEHRSYRSSSDD